MEEPFRWCRKMIVMVDVDNIINDLTKKTITLYNSSNGKNIKFADIVAYSFFKCLPESDARLICDLFQNKELWDSLEPIDGSQNALKELVQSGIEVYFATATDPVNFEWKCKWIAQHFPFIPVDNVIRIKNKSLLKADVIIDDCLDNLTSSNAEKICLNYPWNQDEMVGNVHRADSWDEISNIIKNLERKN